MLRTVNTLSRELFGGATTLRTVFRSSFVRCLGTQCLHRKYQQRPVLYKNTHIKIPNYRQSLRYYADLPDHIKVKLPALSPTMETGNIVSWDKKEGDELKEGDLLAEIETDKATMAFETPDKGFLAKIVAPAGTKNIKVGTLVCIICKDKASVPAFKDFKA